LLEPFGALFDRAGLADVTMPVLIYRAEGSDLRPDGNALALADALPRRPRLAAVPGGHFVFSDGCSPAPRAQPAPQCDDPPGVDRAALHPKIEADIAAFFAANL
jgi:predicted dienelactone hydrolase